MSFAILKLRTYATFRYGFIIGSIVFTSAVIGYLSTNQTMVRPVMAASFGLVLLSLCIRFPRQLMLGLLMYLPIMGFIRRVLIPFIGWNSFDPLVIIAPAIMLLLGFNYFYAYYVRKLPRQPDTRLYRIIKWLILIELLQAFNPLQGSPLTGFGGIMFYIVPLIWMVLSRRLIDDRWLHVVYTTVLVVAVLTSLHGIRQSHGGFFSFELLWVKLAGYDSLMVGLMVRAFSTFTNAAEYAQYLGISIVIAWMFILKAKGLRRLMGIGAFPILFYALFLESSRSSVVLTLVALAITSVLAAKKEQRLLIALAALACVGGIFGFITSMASHDNALVSHLAEGLSNPMDESDSTLSLHMEMFLEGFTKGIMNPVGYGLGSTTIAAQDGTSSEVDLSNMFISNGVVGGVLYLTLFFTVFKLAFRAAQTREIMPLTIAGILIFSAGQWAIGGNYSTAALIWLTIGQLDRVTATMRGNLIEPRLKPVSQLVKE